MTVKELCDRLGYTPLHLGNPQAEVTGGYAGDLLSWVMGRAQMGDVWLTIMSNLNVAAVALMADVACVLLTEGVQPDEALLERMKGQGLNLVSTAQSTFEAACAVQGLL